MTFSHTHTHRALRTYHERVSVSRQQACPVAAPQSTHGSVVRMCGPDEVVHVAVRARHPCGRSHRMAPQHMDGIVQTLQAVFDATRLRSDTVRGDRAANAPLLLLSFLLIFQLPLNSACEILICFCKVNNPLK